jgi:hypothetical protein
MVEEIIGKLSGLTRAEIARLEDELRRERRRRAYSAGETQDAPHVHEGATPLLTEVLEYRPHATVPLASADLIGTSSSTRAASARSSTSAKPVIRRAL